jgi:hypothetical protein
MMNGNTDAALDQVNLAEIQLSFLNMGTQETSTKSNPTSGVCHRRLFIRFEDGGKLYY